MTIYHIIHTWCSGKDLALSARGPRLESGVGNFFLIIVTLIEVLQWVELGCGCSGYMFMHVCRYSL